MVWYHLEFEGSRWASTSIPGGEGRQHAKGVCIPCYHYHDIHICVIAAQRFRRPQHGSTTRSIFTLVPLCFCYIISIIIFSPSRQLHTIYASASQPRWHPTCRRYTIITETFTTAPQRSLPFVCTAACLRCSLLSFSLTLALIHVLNWPVKTSPCWYANNPLNTFSRRGAEAT